MGDFIPIDHKDSDPEGRELVRRGIEDLIGEPLLPVTDVTQIVGRWLLSFPGSKVSPPGTPYEYYANGTYAVGAKQTSHRPADKWRIEDAEAMVVTTWCPPMPDYGIEDGFYSEEAFHCAVLASGGFVRWNGDGSLVQLFTRVTE